MHCWKYRIVLNSSLYMVPYCVLLKMYININKLKMLCSCEKMCSLLWKSQSSQFDLHSVAFNSKSISDRNKITTHWTDCTSYPSQYRFHLRKWNMVSLLNKDHRYYLVLCQNLCFFLAELYQRKQQQLTLDVAALFILIFWLWLRNLAALVSFTSDTFTMMRKRERVELHWHPPSHKNKKEIQV